jgi:hypothetical protein
MARISGRITEVKLNGLSKLGKDLGNKTKEYDQKMQKGIENVTNMVWNIAHQKRPYISKEEQKRGFITKQGYKHHNRVSDPNAQLGVPVAWVNGGTLQSAVRKEVTRKGFGKFEGKVYADITIAPYAHRMEYGDSLVHARPFLRPARNIVKAQLKNLFSIEMK